MSATEHPKEGPSRRSTLGSRVQLEGDEEVSLRAANSGEDEHLQALLRAAEAVTGTFTDIEGQTYAFEAEEVDVEGEAGLYWSVPDEELSLRSGTIILADGEERGTRLVNFTKTDVVTQGGDAAFSFSGVGKIRRLTQVAITTTITNGETGADESNENDLALGLDRINTGIKMNGFRADQTDTRTNSGAPANAGQIVAALKEDGKLRGEILVTGNGISLFSRSRPTQNLP